MESDRISCLPDHLIDKILSHLPIKAAGEQVFYLANGGTKAPHYQILCSIDDVYMLHLPKTPIIWSKFFRLIDRVLLLHSGPINKFKLSNSGYDILGGGNFVADIDSWILHLTGRFIKEFVLTIWMEQPYKIPWCLFSCQTLHRLKLYCCRLKPPTAFEGFRNLKRLELESVTAAQDAFENMISSFPLLEKLKLMGLDGLTHINIHAPNLKSFHLCGKFEDISFENSFQLTRVSVVLQSESNPCRLHGCSSNLLKLFDCRPHIESLAIADYFLKYLAAGVVPVKLSTPFMNLKSLALGINFTDLKEILVVLCLLKSSPNALKVLNVCMHGQRSRMTF